MHEQPEPAIWDALSVPEVAELFARLGAPWWIAGGYAMDTAAGRPIREHGDIDVLLLRRDHAQVHRALDGWDCWVADPPGALRPWPPGEVLPPGVHDVWCRPNPRSPWRLQVMIDNDDGDFWVSRRSSRVRRRIDSLTASDATGIPFLSPEIQLYYKARDPRPKDELDFAAVLPVLPTQQRDWLVSAIRLAYGTSPWLAPLTAVVR